MNSFYNENANLALYSRYFTTVWLFFATFTFFTYSNFPHFNIS